MKIWVHLWLAIWVVGSSLTAAPTIGPWTPLFKGIEYLSATNTINGGGFNGRMVAHALRVDLLDPDIRLMATPRISNYVANVRETAGRTVSRFLATNGLQVAINAGFFSPGEYYLRDGFPMTVRGLTISRGELVSPADGSLPVFIADSNNRAEIIPFNRSVITTNTAFNAIGGNYPILTNGVNIGARFFDDKEPRTVLGLSQDRRHLFLVAIDGRQGGYSVGALHSESAAWLLALGAHDGMNLDGGGSTTMVMEDGSGLPKRLNRSSAVADSGKERTVGSHFGVYARPLGAFINDIKALPDDLSAAVFWNTTKAATGQVEYGTTPSLGESSPLQSENTTNHAVLLRGLKPATPYYFRVLSTVKSEVYASPVREFSTTSSSDSPVLLEITSPWKYTPNRLEGKAWTTRDHNDSDWNGPGPGLLWVDTRASGPNPNVQPRGTEMPSDASSGFPYPTYYIRTHFQFDGPPEGAVLKFSALVDDGAVFYLNGHEIYRLRMPEAPAEINYEDLALGFPCDGDSTCVDDFRVDGELATHLMRGTNVLAAEVHNYNARSPDLTFGAALSVAVASGKPPEIRIAWKDDKTEIQWDRNAFLLQESEALDQPWKDIPGPVLASPYVIRETQTVKYYRLWR